MWSGEREPAELYWEQLSDAGLTMAPLEQRLTLDSRLASRSMHGVPVRQHAAGRAARRSADPASSCISRENHQRSKPARSSQNDMCTKWSESSSER